MLRFLRKYTAHILVVGGCLLMVSFLLQPVLTSCQRSSAGHYAGGPVGSFRDGGSIGSEDIQRAQMEIGLLENTSPLLNVTVRGIDPLRWLLMLHDANSMGISSSDAEAKAILNNCGASELSINYALGTYKATVADLQQALRHWAIVQQYQSIVLGVSHPNTLNRLQTAMQFINASRDGEPNWRLVIDIYGRIGGNILASEPQLKKFVYDRRAEAKITAVEIPASTYQSEIQPPTMEEMKALYEANKGAVAGEGKPYGFGYRVPDRIKFEYLRIPLDRAKVAVKIPEEEAFDYYMKNRDVLFLITPPKKPDTPLLPEFPKIPTLPETPKGDAPKDGAPKTDLPGIDGPKLPLPESPKKEESKDAKAPAPTCGDEIPESDSVTTLAQADPKDTKKDDFNTQPNVGPSFNPALDPTKPSGFFTPETPPGPQYQPYEQVRSRVLSLLREQKSKELVNRMLQEASNILSQDYQQLKQATYYDTRKPGWTPTPFAEVAEKLQKRFGVLPDVVRFDGQWLDQKTVSGLPNIGSATLSGQFASATDYLFSVYELIRNNPNHPLATLRLQEDLPSQPVSDGLASYILRVIDVQLAHTPSFEDSVAQVDRDARKLAAYRVLLTKQSEWIEKAKSQKLEEIASTNNLPIVVTEPFPKREFDASTGSPTVPSLRTLGRQEAVVDAVFAIAERLQETGSVITAPAAERMGSAPMESRLSIALFRVDDYKPITFSDYQAHAGGGTIGSWVAQTAMGPDVAHPLSEEALKKRTGFVRKGDEEKKPEETKKTASAQ